MNARQIILESAALRGKGKFQEAIELIEAHFDDFPKESQTIALVELFKASTEMGDSNTTKKYALKLLEVEPDFPGLDAFRENNVSSIKRITHPNMAKSYCRNCDCETEGNHGYLHFMGDIFLLLVTLGLYLPFMLRKYTAGQRKCARCGCRY